jgi:hypothetical protein
MDSPIQGKDAFGRPTDVYVEPRDDGAGVPLSAPPAVVLLEWLELDRLIHRPYDSAMRCPANAAASDASCRADQVDRALQQAGARN